jgi:HK97 gp10 family phage protein
MADSFKAKVDMSSVNAGLAKLAGPLRESLARSMAVAGGQVLRDEAKQLAPVGTEEGGSIHPGALRDSIYLAYKHDRSLGNQQVYSVTWNAKKAPHGHLIEFGHWQPYVVAKIPGGYGGGYYSTKVKRATPKWTAAHPFLRPALDMAGARAQAAMIERGKVRLPELLAGNTSTDVE